MKTLTKNQIKKAVMESLSLADVLKKLEICDNGKTRKYVKDMITKYHIDFSHQNSQLASNLKNTKWKVIKKTCPVCGNEFETKEGHPREQTTCSYACSNAHFRSGKNNGMYKGGEVTKYQTICFRYHEKKCVVCGEDKIVAVHHYDEDKTNNSPENLIPVCPTHHCYIHSRYKDEVMPVVENYRTWIEEINRP